jgi:IS1 transposase
LCQNCGRNFIENSDCRIISSDKIEQINRALNERNSLRGICRIFGISLSWLMKHVKKNFSSQPDDLNASIPSSNLETTEIVIICEADELWSFVGSKKNPQWIWLVMERESLQVIAFHVGSRKTQSLRKRRWFYKPY